MCDAPAVRTFVERRKAAVQSLVTARSCVAVACRLAWQFSRPPWRQADADGQTKTEESVHASSTCIRFSPTGHHRWRVIHVPNLLLALAMMLGALSGLIVLAKAIFPAIIAHMRSDGQAPGRKTQLASLS